MKVGDLAKKVLSNLGMAVDEDGEPQIEVFDVEWQTETWSSNVASKPSLELSRKGEIEISYGEGGFINGIWQIADNSAGRKRGISGYYVGGGTFDSEGELSGYRGDDNGHFGSPYSLEKEFRVPLLFHISTELMPPEELELLSLLEEGPETWAEDRLANYIIDQINQDASSEVADFVRSYQKEGFFFDGSDLEELVEGEMEWIWERIKGFSGMDRLEIRHEMEVSLYRTTPDWQLDWISEVSSHVRANGMPDGFALIRDLPTKSVSPGHYLLYGRTGFRGDPDAPSDDWEIRDILHSIDPVEYPEDIELEQTPRTLVKDSWWIAEVPSGKILLDERSRYEEE